MHVLIFEIYCVTKAVQAVKATGYRLVQQICDENQKKGSVSDKSTKISRKLAEMIPFEISYGPKLKKSKMTVIFKMATKL